LSTVEIEIPRRSVYVGVVRLALAALARSAGLDEACVDDLKIAVSEACANAVLSDAETDSDEPVVIDWTEERGRVIVEVQDRSATYDLDHPQREFDGQDFSNRFALSVELLKSLVDECRIEPREGGGMLTRLVVNR
jgi:serine/threonine-protein kinase RsbW